MTRNHARRVLLALLAIGALALGAAAYASASGTNVDAGRHGSDRTIRLVETSAVPPLKVIDLDKPGLSAGDHVVVKDGVAREAGGPAAGVLRQECTLIEVGAGLATSTFECSGSIALSAGTLIIQGPFVPAAPEQSQAVTGGTGAFRAARGDAIVRAEDDQIDVRLVR
jgi:hypothetical protein